MPGMRIVRFAVLLALSSCCALGKDPQPREVKTEEQIQAEQESKRLEHWPDEPGEVGYAYLWDKRSAELLVFPTEEVYDAWQSAIARDDAVGKLAVINASYDIAPGTKVKYLRGVIGSIKVEILEGKHRGNEGWIQNTFVHRAPIPPASKPVVKPAAKPKAKPAETAPMQDNPYE